MLEPLQDERRWTLCVDGQTVWAGWPSDFPGELNAEAFPHVRVEVVPASSLDQALAERDKAREALYECAVLSGADVSDGAPGWPPIEEWAVQEVKQLRDDYDEALRDG